MSWRVIPTRFHLKRNSSVAESGLPQVDRRPTFNRGMKTILSLAIVTLAAALITSPLTAAEKLTIQVMGRPVSAYRTADLEQAKKETKETKKPIAWIASSPKVLENNGDIKGKSGRAATSHAFAALGGRAVLVFMDAFEENHKVLKLVDDALHTPNPHYTPPTVVFLDPEAKQVLATVIYEKDFQKRAGDLAKALEEI